jgi:hypothetical protein
MLDIYKISKAIGKYNIHKCIIKFMFNKFITVSKSGPDSIEKASGPDPLLEIEDEVIPTPLDFSKLVGVVSIFFFEKYYLQDC